METTTQQKRRTGETANAARDGKAPVADRGRAIREKLDDLMDEIDEILEENADEMVKGYVQESGQ